MAYKLIISPLAEEHIKEWNASGNKAAIKKLIQFFEELVEHPTTGTGKVERLDGYDCRWSRRINKKDRLIYDVFNQVVSVEVVSAKGHYDDK
jgi:toxin YoeB